MKPFVYTRAASADDAVTAASRPGVAILAGGTELLNWMRTGVSEPQAVVDIGRLPLEEIRLDGDVVHIGPLARLNDVAAHELVRDRFPVLRQAIHKSASAQLRNLATIGGNPLQSTRCPYFRSESLTPCNKRHPGSGCAARHGIADNHAIFGWTDDCVAVQPSDPATALVALDSTVVTADRNGGRRLAIRELHSLPAEDPTVHHVLRPGEIIVDIEISGVARASAYVKVRERESYEYALVSAAVALDLDRDLITHARIAVGSVAMRPWRLEAAERALAGMRVGSPEIGDSVKAAFADARPLPDSKYKVRLAQNAVLRAIEGAARS
ncbi:MAG TPA: xanthine dehydrogenase family protein subunit M [Solirubrobacteraceae bacterium]